MANRGNHLYRFLKYPTSEEKTNMFMDVSWSIHPFAFESALVLGDRKKGSEMSSSSVMFKSLD